MIRDDRRDVDPFPNWFVSATVLLAVAGSLGLPNTLLFLVAVTVVLAGIRDLWQALLTLTLGSLTLATTGAKVSLSQPYLLRFVLLAALLVLLIAQHLLPRGARGSRALQRGVLAIVIFSIWGTITAITADFFVTSLEAALAVTVAFAVPIAAALGRWRSRVILVADLTILLRFLWVFATIGVGLAVSEGLFGRSSGLHANPNTFAFMCALGFGLSLGLSLRIRRGIGPIVIATFGLGVLLSGSRGALAGSVLAVVHLIVRRATRRRSRGLAVATGAAIVTLLIAPVPQVIDLGSAFSRTFGGEELNFAGRQARWQDMQVLIAQRPVTGHGLRSTQEALGAAAQTGLTETAGAHNSYLTIVAEAGIVGALLLLIVIVGAIRLGPPSDETGRAVWIGASSVMMVGLGHMLGESFILGVGSPFPFIFWTNVIIVLTIGCRQQGVSRT